MRNSFTQFLCFHVSQFVLCIFFFKFSFKNTNFILDIFDIRLLLTNCLFLSFLMLFNLLFNSHDLLLQFGNYLSVLFFFCIHWLVLTAFCTWLRTFFLFLFDYVCQFPTLIVHEKYLFMLCLCYTLKLTIQVFSVLILFLPFAYLLIYLSNFILIFLTYTHVFLSLLLLIFNSLCRIQIIFKIFHNR